MNKTTHLSLVAAALVIAVGPALALAGPDTDVGFRGWGPRVGLSLHPTRFTSVLTLTLDTSPGTSAFNPTWSWASATT